MMGLPLDGITVIALEQAVSAPFTTRQLADWGARVIKVEQPGVGDRARRFDEAVLGQSSYFVWLNRGKESVTLDLKTKSGMEIFETLLGKADVLVQNLGPMAFDRLGLSPTQISQQFPHLIGCHISGYGLDGPYRDRQANDLLIQADTGLLSTTGTPEHPAKVGVPVADLAAGMYGLTSVLMAILQRQQTHQGTIIDVSMLEALAEWMGHPLNLAHFSSQDPPRSGAHHATMAPYGLYSVAEGEDVFLAVENEDEWRAFCGEVLQQSEMSNDPHFVTNAARVENRDLLQTAISGIFSGIGLEEVLARLEQAHIAYAHLNSVEQLWHHPQLYARQRWSSITIPGGTVGALLPPMIFSDADPLMGDVPVLGGHTDGVLRELGFSDEAIMGLRAKGVI